MSRNSKSKRDRKKSKRTNGRNKSFTRYSKTPSFRKSGFDQPVNDVCLALKAHRGDDHRPSGTAVLISRGYAIAAKHVIEDYMRFFDNHKLGDNGEQEFETKFHMQAFNMQKNGKVGTLFNITRMWISGVTDIAFLRLTPVNTSAKNFKMPPSACLDLLIPKIGERISGFGYPSPSVELAEKSLTWAVDPSTSVGEVSEVHYERRDSAMLNFPCFRTNARFDASMSGGPVFNDKGRVCGLICSSIPAVEGDSDHISYVTALWPLGGLRIDAPREDLPEGGHYFVNELFRNGYVKANGWERIKLKEDSEGGKLEIGFNSD